MDRTKRLECDFCFAPDRVEAMRAREKMLTALFHKAEADLEEQRKHMSLELHDEVGQVLTSLLLQLKILRDSDDLEYIKGRMGGLQHITAVALEEVRQLSRNLRPLALEKLGLQTALTSHVKDYMSATGIQTNLHLTGLDAPIPEQVQTTLYRAVQEGLSNAARHGDPTEIDVTIARGDGQILLKIEDDGKGMQPNQAIGLGLLGMEERTRVLGGRFWYFNREPQGFCINIKLNEEGADEPHDEALLG